MNGQLRFAHLSDWHATSLAGGGRDRFRGKRLSGWASWALKRRRHHDPAILDAAIRDVRSQAVDRVLVTGDLTHISLEQEFEVAATQLAKLGSPEEVFVIPGNHDCYVQTESARSWDHWAPYLRGTDANELPPSLARLASPSPPKGVAPSHDDYPTLRLHGRLAAVGLCSSIPTPIFVAGGRLGETQLDRLEGLLEGLGNEGYFRVLLIHHPIARGSEPARRALWDGEALCGVLERVGAELVLHGHKHRRRLRHVPGPHGDVPIVGVPSSSEIGSKPDKHAQYHLYSVREEAGGFQIEAEIRGYDTKSGAFEPVAESLFE